MANYYGTARTNYFRVTDEAKHRFLFARLSGEDSIKDFSKEKEGEIWHGFGAYSNIDYLAIPTLSEFMKEEAYKNAKSYVYSYENTETDKIDEEMLNLYVVDIFTDEKMGSPLYIQLSDDFNDCKDSYCYGFDAFISELQEILDPRDAFIYMESGYEKLRYVTGYAICVTKDKVENVDIINWAEEISKKMLNNPNYNPQLTY